MLIEGDYFKNIFNTVREAILILDENMKVLSANRSFFNIFKVDSANTIGSLLYDLGNGQWNIPYLRVLLEDVLPKNDTVDDYEIEHNFESIGKKTMLLNACKITENKNDLPIILLAIEDITERKLAGQLLRESQEGFRFALDVSETGQWDLDLIDHTVRRSLKHDQIFGYKTLLPQWTFEMFLEHVVREDRAVVNQKFQQAIESKGDWNFECRIIRRDGEQRWILARGRHFLNHNGQPRRMVGIVQDITARKVIEVGLEKTRKELEVIKKSADEASEFAESVINTVREPLISLNQDLRVVAVSRSFYEFFKVKPEETVGQLIYDLGNRQWDIPKLRELLEDILPKKVSFDNYEVEHDFTTIGRRIMLLNARQIQRVSGKDRIILLAIEDITERREIEIGLEKTRKELAATKISEDAAREYSESIINTIREPLIALDQDLRVVSVSRSFYDSFKVTPQETIGNLIYDLGNRQWDIPKLRTLLEEIIPRDNKFDDYEVEHEFSNIGHKIMLLNARRITQKEIGSQLILLAIEDVTEKTRLQRELAERTYDAEKAQSEAEEANRTKSDFLANMSHELRTPLNSIIGFSEILEDGMAGPIADNQKELLNDISTSGKHLLSLINDILDLAKVEAGKMELKLGESNLEEMIDGSLVMFREKAMKHYIKVAAEVEAEIGNIIADERKIKQILFNLLSNAFKFTPEGGSVNIAARRISSDAGAGLVPALSLTGHPQEMPLQKQDSIEISVTDTGIGIFPEDREKLFQPFQQIDSTLSRKHSGTGLGLNLCKKFVELHGGRIWMESEVDKGSRFVFEIPIKQTIDH